MSIKVKENQNKQLKYNSFETKGKNIIWAGAMCLAWQELKQNIIKQPIKLVTKNKHVLSIVDNFNNSNFLKKDLSQESYYIKSGFGNKTVETINKQVSAKFKQKTLPKLDFGLNQDELISFAYIFKKFDFLNKFQPQEKGTFLFQKQKVNSFYAQTIEQKKNVFYFKYENENDFLIGIKGKNPIDSIFLLKSNDELSIDQVFKTVIYHENKGAKRYLTSIDQFQMPIVKIEANRDIKEIEGLKFSNKSFYGQILAKATQMIKFQINESGAKFENQAYIASKCKRSEKFEPKRFILNKRFWIVMKEVNKHPYLCMKIVKPTQTINQGKK